MSARSRSAATAVSTASPVPVVADALAAAATGGSAIDARSRSCAARSVADDLARRSRSASSGVDDALLDEPRGVLLADRRLRLDPLDHAAAACSAASSCSWWPKRR